MPEPAPDLAKLRQYVDAWGCLKLDRALALALLARAEQAALLESERDALNEIAGQRLLALREVEARLVSLGQTYEAGNRYRAGLEAKAAALTEEVDALRQLTGRQVAKLATYAAGKSDAESKVEKAIEFAEKLRERIKVVSVERDRLAAALREARAFHLEPMFDAKGTYSQRKTSEWVMICQVIDAAIAPEPPR